jgi:hypothetical protein
MPRGRGRPLNHPAVAGFDEARFRNASLMSLTASEFMSQETNWTYRSSPACGEDHLRIRRIGRSRPRPKQIEDLCDDVQRRLAEDATLTRA